LLNDSVRGRPHRGLFQVVLGSFQLFARLGDRRVLSFFGHCGAFQFGLVQLGVGLDQGQVGHGGSAHIGIQLFFRHGAGGGQFPTPLQLAFSSFLFRFGLGNRGLGNLHSGVQQFRLLPGVAPAIRRLNLSEYRCCVITNQPVVARGECSFEGLREIHNKLDTLLGAEGAFIDQLYFCPHHPHSGFAGERPELKVVCDCRKPATGLIEQAQNDLNTCREASWVIGDSTVDIETARTAGIKSILVESGYAGLDGRYWAEADFRLPDLSESVTFVLDVFPRLLDYAKSKTGAVEAGSLLLLGGQSRSGKSHLASAMRMRH